LRQRVDKLPLFRIVTEQETKFQEKNRKETGRGTEFLKTTTTKKKRGSELRKKREEQQNKEELTSKVPKIL
jgi:hypothetical protein